ncbi:MAG: hypothetical protein KBF28_05400 [Gemmatimonadales bacterium]|nr:hypothetical protein [Gemmatimonadales bacterium]
MALSVYDDRQDGGGGDSEQVKQGTYNTTTGQSSGKFGQFKTDDMAFLLQAMQNSPEYAAMALRLAQGQKGRPLGRFAGARDNLYGKALQSALSFGGLNGMGSLESIANDFLTQGVQGNNLLGYAGGLGQQARGQDFAGVDSLTMEKILRAGLALEGLNMGSLGGEVNSGYLDDVIWQDEARGLQQGFGGDETNFADLLNQSKYKRAMSAFR